MKHFSKFMIGALALGLWSCSSEEPLPGGGESNGTKGDFNATLTLQLPVGNATRSATVDGEEPAESDAGYEIGQIGENNVNEVLVVLATQNPANENEFTYITYGLSTASILKDEPTDTPTTGGDANANPTPTYALQFESQTLGEQFGKEIYVFTYCNPTAAIKNYFEGTPDATKWIDEVYTLTAAPTGLPTETGAVWQNNKFLMTNAKLSAPVLLKDANVTDQTKEHFMTNHGTPATAFNLGTVKVERVAARFDFEAKKVEGELEENSYVVVDNRNSNDQVAIVTLEGMALFNVAKQAYYIPRVSDNGLLTGTNYEICGNERTNNWVVGPFATAFPVNPTQDTPNTAWGETLWSNYFYQLNTIPSYDNLAWTSLINWNATHDADNKFDWATGENNPYAGTNYRIWCYTNESVSPGVLNQRQGSTTGIMFKAQLKSLNNPTSEQGKVIKASMGAGKALYALDGTIYGDVAHVALYAKVHPDSKLATAWKNSGLSGAGQNGQLIVENPDHSYSINPDIEPTEGNKANCVAAGFAVYTPDADGKYYMYYPYFNRHNSINANDGMSIMEYQVVRNNVYKLKVNSILNFGHPDIPGDPDKPGNGKEDETPKVLFRVSVQVLPWVVRVNNIDF